MEEEEQLITALKYSAECGYPQDRDDVAAGLGMTCGQQPAPVLSPAQIKKKEAQAGNEKHLQR